MFEQVCNVVLDLLELVQLEIRVWNRKNIRRLGVLVNKDAFAVLTELALHLEQAFALQHHGQDITGRSILGFIQLKQLAEQRFGRVLLDGFGRLGGRGMVDALPLGDVALSVFGSFGILRLPARLADIKAQILMFLVAQDGTI